MKTKRVSFSAIMRRNRKDKDQNETVFSIDPTTEPLLQNAPEIEGYKVLGPCVLYTIVGRGGMGVVYKAKHLNLDLDVAVKCLDPKLVSRSEEFVIRFQREARVAARINHPNVVRVFDVSECNGLHYLVMEYVEGEDARLRVHRKGRLPISEALLILREAAKGIAEAHRHGLVHRDVKPDNILISTKGEVKIADLGLAKAVAGDTNMTQVRSRMGTPQYMPLEQWENVRETGPPADVWALGATLYFFLSGKDAVQGEGIFEILNKLLHEPFPDIRKIRSEVPDDVVKLIERATRKDPGDRYPSAVEFSADLEKLSHYMNSDLSDPFGTGARSTRSLVSPPPKKSLMKIKLSVADSLFPSTRPHRFSGLRRKFNNPTFVASFIIAVLLTAVLLANESIRNSIYDVYHSAGSYMSAIIGNKEHSSGSGDENTLDSNAYQRAISVGTILAYQAYLNAFPQGDYADSVRARILEIRDEEAFNDALSLSTKESFILYLTNFPDGKFVDAARESIDVIRDYEEYQIAKSEDTITLLQKYVSDHPGGAFVGEARRRIDRLEDKRAYERAIALNTVESLKGYLNRYPSGIYVSSVNDRLQTLHQTQDVQIEMISVRGGTFFMGDEGLGEQSSPVHPVTVSSFYIGKYEITQRQWRDIMGENPSFFTGCDDCPVEQVSWIDVQEFIKRLNETTGKSYRLPTEAEWEYAARGGKESNGYAYSGGNNADQVAWYRENADNTTHPVGSKKANELGLYDMSGNVLEWCNDLYDESYYSRSPQQDPRGPTVGTYRVVRGGYWDSDFTVGERYFSSPSARFYSIGFRLVMSGD